MYLIEATASQIVSKRKIDNGSRDKSDNKYIECELTAQFDYIISGDIHLFGANQINWLVETPYSKILSQSR
jgi:predicted nucleic acid-binding protein